MNQIRWAASQHRALQKLAKNYAGLATHVENVAADKRHERNAECQGVLALLSSLKFVKMLMFLIDLHAVTKALSVAFQREDILLIEVKPLVKRTLL